MLEPDQTDTDRVFHVSYCQHCSARDAIRLSETALERRPWRVTWRCLTCNNLAEAKVPPQILRDLRRFDRVNGMRISLREYWSFVAALDDLEEAFEDELL